MQKIQIGKKHIGEGQPCYIIAEAGVNHNGDLRIAKKLVKSAARAGADAVKFQTFSAESIATRTARKAAYQKRRSKATESQYEMLRRLELPREAFETLFSYAEACGIEFLSSPFDLTSADLLESIGVAAFKVPSGEITNIPLLSRIGGFNKPIILSTGMATLNEIREGIETLRTKGAQKIVLLHCVTSYPAPLESINLRMIETLAREFALPVGFSDHTEGVTAAIIARALGACVIEKHFTLDRNLPGPDHKASVEPAVLADMVKQVRLTESALGEGIKSIGRTESAIRKIARKSLVAAIIIPKGTKLNREMIDIKRPGTGIETKHLDTVIGMTARRAIQKDTVISWDMLQ